MKVLLIGLVVIIIIIITLPLIAAKEKCAPQVHFYKLIRNIQKRKYDDKYAEMIKLFKEQNVDNANYMYSLIATRSEQFNNNVNRLLNSNVDEKYKRGLFLLPDPLFTPLIIDDSYVPTWPPEYDLIQDTCITDLVFEIEKYTGLYIRAEELMKRAYNFDFTNGSFIRTNLKRIGRNFSPELKALFPDMGYDWIQGGINSGGPWDYTFAACASWYGRFTANFNKITNELTNATKTT